MPVANKKEEVPPSKTSVGRRVLAAMQSKPKATKRLLEEDEVQSVSEITPASIPSSPKLRASEPAPPSSLPPQTPDISLEAALEAALEAVEAPMDTSEEKGVKVSPTEAPPAPKGEEEKAKKRPRFGKNPDGTPAPKVPKKIVECKTPWGQFLRKFKAEHPDLSSAEAEIEARKNYIPKSGKEKSFERIFSEVWKRKNPKWEKLTKEELRATIRADFIKMI